MIFLAGGEGGYDDDRTLVGVLGGMVRDLLRPLSPSPSQPADDDADDGRVLRRMRPADASLLVCLLGDVPCGSALHGAMLDFTRGYCRDLLVPSPPVVVVVEEEEEGGSTSPATKTRGGGGDGGGGGGEGWEDAILCAYVAAIASIARPPPPGGGARGRPATLSSLSSTTKSSKSSKSEYYYRNWKILISLIDEME